MAKSHKVNYVIWLLLFVGISGILFASSSSSQFYLFEAPPELRQVGGCFRNCIDDTQTGFSNNGGQTDSNLDDTNDNDLEDTTSNTIFDDISNALFGDDTTDDTTDDTKTDDTKVSSSEIICKVSTNVLGLDVNGVQVINRESNVFLQNDVIPLDLVNPTNEKIINSLNMVHKLTCNISGESNDLENLSVKSSALTTTIFGNIESGAVKEVWNSKIRNSNAIELSNDVDNVLSSHSASVSDIHKYLPKGDYKTTLKFLTTGDITLVNDITYKTAIITLDNGSVVTSLDLDVIKNTEPETKPETETETETEIETEKESNKTLSLIEEFTFCINTFDIDCLTNQQFLPLYIGSFGLIFLVGAVGTRNKPMFDQFGNRA